LWRNSTGFIYKIYDCNMYWCILHYIANCVVHHMKNASSHIFLHFWRYFLFSVFVPWSILRLGLASSDYPWRLFPFRFSCQKYIPLAQKMFHSVCKTPMRYKKVWDSKKLLLVSLLSRNYQKTVFDPRVSGPTVIRFTLLYIGLFCVSVSLNDISNI